MPLDPDRYANLSRGVQHYYWSSMVRLRV